MKNTDYYYFLWKKENTLRQVCNKLRSELSDHIASKAPISIFILSVFWTIVDVT